MRKNVSFASVAFRVGAVSLEDLRRAYATSRAEGTSMEAVLTGPGVMDPALVAFVRDVLARARISCGRCGGRAGRRVASREFTCRCPATSPVGQALAA